MFFIVPNSFIKQELEGCCMHTCSVASVVSDSVTLWTVVGQSPLFMGFSRQEYWSGLPRPPADDLHNPGMKPTSAMFPAVQASSLPLSHQGNPKDC